MKRGRHRQPRTNQPSGADHGNEKALSHRAFGAHGGHDQGQSGRNIGRDQPARGTETVGIRLSGQRGVNRHQQEARRRHQPGALARPHDCHNQILRAWARGQPQVCVDARVVGLS